MHVHAVRNVSEIDGIRGCARHKWWFNKFKRRINSPFIELHVIQFGNGNRKPTFLSLRLNIKLAFSSLYRRVCDFIFVWQLCAAIFCHCHRPLTFTAGTTCRLVFHLISTMQAILDFMWCAHGAHSLAGTSSVWSTHLHLNNEWIVNICNFNLIRWCKYSPFVHFHWTSLCAKWIYVHWETKHICRHRYRSSTNAINQWFFFHRNQPMKILPTS